MKKILSATRAILALCVFRMAFPKYEILVIETNIFGHAILESALFQQYILEHPKKKITYVLHEHSANSFLTKSIINSLNQLQIRENKIGKYAIHGQDILVNRINMRPILNTVRFQEELSHLTACEINKDFLPQFKFEAMPRHQQKNVKKTIILMNRSAAYRKYKEKSDLHSYRDFRFSSIDNLSLVSSDQIQFLRIGTPDGIETKNKKIKDMRGEILVNPELDIKLQTSASGYFGADSGPAWLAFGLKIPVAFINMIPLNQTSPIQQSQLVVIPKLLHSRDESRLLRIDEMLSPEISNLRTTHEYERLGLIPITNSDQDVHDFFFDWVNMITSSAEIVDVEYMSKIRKKFDLPYLASIHHKFIQNHPEVFRN